MIRHDAGEQFLLGLDTGGTHTDAVLLDAHNHHVVAKAKALTTRHDLMLGIGRAVETVMRDSGIDPAHIAMVSLSTTLATNALVEGQGGRAVLVMIGFGTDELSRNGLGTALGRDPVIFLPGGHDVHGRERPLEISALSDRIEELAGQAAGFAIAGCFAVRNPAHEITVRDFIRKKTKRPVTSSHELSSQLGGPRRALTTLLNARLIPLIDRLITACENFLRASKITAPLMMVRGDGTLMMARQARLRPIETILSGPAASLVGARNLAGLGDGVVTDIGGTTLDVAILTKGRPRMDSAGAKVGSMRTMVEAVATSSFGLGGDSEIRMVESGLDWHLEAGPRRFVPLCLLAHESAPHREIVLETLRRQAGAERPGRLDGRFAMAVDLPEIFAAGLSPHEKHLLQALDAAPVALDQLLKSTAQRATLDRLVARGLVMLCGFTPTDALNALGLETRWNSEAARLGAASWARRKNGAGRRLAQDGQHFARLVIERFNLRAAQAILSACLREQGDLDIDPQSDRVIEKALSMQSSSRSDESARRLVRLGVELDRPLIALGASAGLYFPAIAEALGARLIIPEHGDVASAIGAVTGQVCQAVSAMITASSESTFIVTAGDISRSCDNEEEALAFGEDLARRLAIAAAQRNGVTTPAVTLSIERQAPEIDGKPQLMEARLTAVALGQPDFAQPAR